MYARQYCSTYSLYMRNDRLSLTSKAVISWYDFLKGLTVCGQCPFIVFSITVLYGAVKPSVARERADYSRADIVLYCSLQYRYSIWQITAHTTYSVYNAIAYTLFCVLDGCNTLAITHNPEATGLSPIPATMFNRWFRKKSAVFCIFWRACRGVGRCPSPNCTPTGYKIGGMDFVEITEYVQIFCI